MAWVVERRSKSHVLRMRLDYLLTKIENVLGSKVSAMGTQACVIILREE